MTGDFEEKFQMSAPRTNAAIASDLAEWRKGVSSQPLKAVIMEAIAALRKEPPALPAEVEAVVAKLKLQSVVPNQEMTIGEVRVTKQRLLEAATLLRCYAQAVAEKYAEIARLDAALVSQMARVCVAEKKLRAVEALCDEWDDIYALELATMRNDMPYEIDPAVRHHLEAIGELRKILGRNT